MKIRILMITHNRPAYTRLSLRALCESLAEDRKAVIWDNASNKETKAVIAEFANHPQIERIIYNPTNEKLRGPTNWFWEHARDADYVGKIDDDCLVPDNWCETLARAHSENPKLGLVGCWRFYDEDFVAELAERKIRKLNGGHQIMLNCWLQGSGYLMKRKCVQQLGLLRPKESFTGYCVRAALNGWQIGWYYPFIHEEHMDDPRSPYCLIKTDADLMANRPLSARMRRIRTVSEWMDRISFEARSIQEASPDPKDFVGWRLKLSRIKRRLGRMVGKRDPWRV